MIKGLITAVRTLTIVPLPGKDAAHFSDALPWFSAVGLILGLVLFGLGRGLDYLLDSWFMGAAALILIAGVVLTRGLHLDGLADWFDGLGAGKSPERILSVMKDPHVGVFGVLAVVLVLLAKFIALSHLLEKEKFFFVVAAYLVSRTVLVELSVCYPYARSEGGTAGPFITTAKPSHRVIAWSATALLLLLFYGMIGIPILALGWGSARLMGVWFMRRVNGVTGDLLGTCCELTETGLLIVCAVL